MSERQINDQLGTTIDKIKDMVDVNTIIGDPIKTDDGITIIPISRVSYGFATGGSDVPSKSQPEGGLFMGGSGAGISIFPIGFLVISNGNVRMLQIEPFFSSIDRVIEKVPDMVDQIAGFIKKDDDEKSDKKSKTARRNKNIDDNDDIKIKEIIIEE